MLFQSALYFLFLPATVASFWLTPARLRLHVLLVASYVFYATWNAPYAAMMFLLVIVNWAAACVAVQSRRHRSHVVAAAICADLALLAVFKYSGFLVETGVGLVGLAGGPPPVVRAPDLLLPLGISFFTFEFIHFLVEVRRGAMPPRGFSDFHLFSAFFPTQIAGPIKRFDDFLPQLRSPSAPSPAIWSEAAELIVFGLFKKLALADNLAPVVDGSLSHVYDIGFLSAWTAMVAFAFQIYFDFSGYTDIARGSALLFGIRIPINFSNPYLARNVSEFWDRWHISLSRWLRDYLFIPLGGSRLGLRRTIRNLLITMLLGGLWHGAAWHFVAWGAYWGVLLSAFHVWRSRRERLPVWARRVVLPAPVAIATTFVLALFGWCLFRLPIDMAWTLVAAMLTPALGDAGETRKVLFVAAIAFGYFAFAAGAVRLDRRLAALPGAVRGFGLAVLLAAALVAAPTGTQEFIYFQF